MSRANPSPVTEGDNDQEGIADNRCANGYFDCPGPELSDPDGVLSPECRLALSRWDERPVAHRPTTSPYSGF